MEIAKSLPFQKLYVADLDGIVRGKPDRATLMEINKFRNLIADIGIRNERDLNIFKDLSSGVVVGTETAESPGVFKKALEMYGSQRVYASIDLKDGEVLSLFLSKIPLKAYSSLIEIRLIKTIFLNISSVGTQESDFSFIKDLNKTGEILLGGGITKKDLGYLERKGIDGVLVGTALHKGLWM